jgi:VWFA-related protein
MFKDRIYRWLVLLLCPALALAQTPETTIQITSRIVYVDVVVHDSSGRLVPGLTQKDFKVSEDGQPQQIDFFLAHSYDIAGSHPAPARPNKNEFSNVPVSGPAGSVNIILFDLVNTAPQDQQYARKQMLGFLKALPPGQQVALFVLSDQLHLFQSFTGSSDLLLAAAKMIDPTNMRLYQSDAEQQRDIDNLGRMQDALGGRDPAMSIQALANEMTQENVISDQIRQRITITAFSEIAHAAAGYPGRKNLFWLSGSFPFSISMQGQYNITAPLQYSTLNNPDVPIADENSVQDTAKLIANSQIAVYPISAVGLETGGVGVDVSGGSMASMAGSAPQSGAVGSDSVKHTMGDTLAQQFTNRGTLHGAMQDIAYETGGEAIFSSNDLSAALRRSILDGSNYYTLAYRPQNHDWNGKFHKIKVEMAQRGYTLSYRRGYFAFADQLTNEDAAQELNAALQPEAPESTLLRLTAKVIPPTAQDPNVYVQSSVDAASLQLTTDAAGTRHGRLLVLLIGLNDGPTQPDSPPQTSGSLHLDFTPEQYKDVLANGIRFQQKMMLKPGKYRLRLGVTDMSNHRLGTLDMPLVIAAPA